MVITMTTAAVRTKQPAPAPSIDLVAFPTLGGMVPVALGKRARIIVTTEQARYSLTLHRVEGSHRYFRESRGEESRLFYVYALKWGRVSGRSLRKLGVTAVGFSFAPGDNRMMLFKNVPREICGKPIVRERQSSFAYHRVGRAQPFLVKEIQVS